MSIATTVADTTSASQTAASIASSYDDLPYTSVAFAQTHPAHLHALAHMMGLPAVLLDNARILELGCAAGGNLWPLAYRYPQASVVGIDLSPKQIADGQRVAAALGISNLQLIAGSIADIDDSWGKFDYIIAHGVYSWVPTDVQAAVLRVCANNLSATGVAYVSYNTYPGWKGREIVREAMLFRAQHRGGDVQNRVSMGLGMVDFLAEHANTPWVKQSNMELQITFKTASNSYIAHEFLELFNAPCYFHEFMARANSAGLNYLCESEVATIYANNIAADVRQDLIAECGGSQVVLEQYMDFLNNRGFRQTLLVGAQRKPNYNTPPAAWQSLHYACKLPPAAAAPEKSYTTASGATLTPAKDWEHAVIAALNQAYPATLSFNQLKLVAQQDDAAVASFCSLLVQQLGLNPSSNPVVLAAKPSSAAPLAEAYVLACAKLGEQLGSMAGAPAGQLTNMRHTPLQFDPAFLPLIAQLDGTRPWADVHNPEGLDVQLLYTHGLMLQ
jgi:methyltransferase-like protein/SAM-dependent methyltransferase